MDDNSALLDQTIKSELEAINELDVGSEEHARAVESIEKLYKLKGDDLNRKQRKIERRKDRIIKILGGIGNTAVSVGGLGLMYYAGMKYEKDDSFRFKTFSEYRRIAVDFFKKKK